RQKKSAARDRQKKSATRGLQSKFLARDRQRKSITMYTLPLQPCCSWKLFGYG
ncbi:putative transferase, partial [Trypoxylus dichotomus]